MEKIGECPVCGINIYDNPKKNKKFKVREKTLIGYPSEKTMPCGIKAAKCPFDD